MPSSPIKKILVVNIFGIGDVLFTTPLLRNIKKNIPDAVIGYIANRRAEAVLKNNPYINNLYIYERDEFQAISRQSKRLFLKRGWEFLNLIRKEKYDLLIDLSLNRGVGLWAWVAGIPQRVGFNYKKRGLFLTKKIKFAGYEDRHVVEYYLGLLEELGWKVDPAPMDLPITQEDELWADFFLRQQGSPADDPKIAIVPGGGASWGKDAVYKRWPAEKYAQLADKIFANLKTPIILLGDEKERGLCEQIADLMKHKVIMACGQTTIGQCSALFKQCALAVVNDGGPLHIAVASGIPTIAIFGPVNENVYGPYPRANHFVVTHDIACRPCYHQFRRASCDHLSCLNNIEVNDVFQKVNEALNYVPRR